MIRKKIFGALHHEQFRHRGDEILRIEALSDAVFAFSVSLLVAALEVPQTFEELTEIIAGGIPFFATVALVFLFWYQQYIYFRHYALNDATTILINLLYLALILFYIYPLKFLFSLLLMGFTGINLFPKAAAEGLPVLTQEQFPHLVLLFSVGYMLIWLLLYLMHVRAMSFARELSLNAYELLYTRKEKRGALWNALIGFTALLLAITGIAWLSGLCYLFIPVVLIANEQLFKRQLKRLPK